MIYMALSLELADTFNLAWLTDKILSKQISCML